MCALIPGHVKGLRQTAVQVEVVADHSSGTVALPVQHVVVDLIDHMHRHGWELLQHRHPRCQAPQLPVGLHGDERRPPPLLLSSTDGAGTVGLSSPGDYVCFFLVCFTL